MRAALALLALAACGGKPAPAGPVVDNDAPAAPRPVYAALFEPGAAWTFEVETLDDTMRDDGSGFDTREDAYQATCRVERVEDLGGVKVSEISCDDAAPTALVGVWAMDARGLWSLDGWPDGAPELGDEPMIADPPAEWQRDELDPEYGDEPIGETSVEQRDGAWCWSTSNSQGDASWASVCFGPDGPTEGSLGWSGAEEHSSTFRRAD